MGILLALLTIAELAAFSQDGDEYPHLVEIHQPDRRQGNIQPASPNSPPAAAVCRIEAEVQSEQLEVFDRPSDKGYITGQVQRGDRLTVRTDRFAGEGWLAIVPLPTSIFWIEQASLESDDEPDALKSDGLRLAWVSQPRAVIRSGHSRARLPGPPLGELPKGTMVQLVDRSPLNLGKGSKPSRWLAIVPPADQVLYVRAAGLRMLPPTLPDSPATLASYEEPLGPEPNAGAKPKASKPGGPTSWPPGASAELQRLDAMTQVIVASQPIDQWRFEAVRAGYQGLLKQADDHLELEETLRTRLNRLTHYEQAAKAARTIEGVLARSHRRDHEVAAIRKDLAQLERTRARSFDAVGFIQPSARKVDGHKVFALIGGMGSTIAYLDVPPGLDPQPFLARKIGVRGQPHWNEELGTRLITVRDLEIIEARK